MFILSIRTDNAEAEVGLYNDTEQIAYIKWQAHRQLAETIHIKIKELLDGQQMEWSKIEGIVCFQGPGSFTGLRIGLSTGNALSYALNIPIIGKMGENWQEDGIKRLSAGENDQQVIPEYGAPVHITKPRK